MNQTHHKPCREENKKNHITEEDLVAEFVRTGQNELLGQLYGRCYDRIYRQCYYMFKDRALAQDCAHDIFLKIIPKLSTFKQNSRFSSWLLRITYNHCLDHYRNSKNKAALSIDDYPELTACDPWMDYLQDEPNWLNRLTVAISVLPPEEQMTLQLRYGDNLSLQAISVKFNITLSATKMRLLRCRRKLRDAVMQAS